MKLERGYGEYKLVIDDWEMPEFIQLVESATRIHFTRDLIELLKTEKLI